MFADEIEAITMVRRQLFNHMLLCFSVVEHFKFCAIWPFVCIPYNAVSQNRLIYYKMSCQMCDTRNVRTSPMHGFRQFTQTLSNSNVIMRHNASHVVGKVLFSPLFFFFLNSNDLQTEIGVSGYLLKFSSYKIMHIYMVMFSNCLKMSSEFVRRNELMRACVCVPVHAYTHKKRCDWKLSNENNEMNRVKLFRVCKGHWLYVSKFLTNRLISLTLNKTEYALSFSCFSSSLNAFYR